MNIGGLLIIILAIIIALYIRQIGASLIALEIAIPEEILLFRIA